MRDLYLKAVGLLLYLLAWPWTYLIIFAAFILLALIVRYILLRCDRMPRAD